MFDKLVAGLVTTHLGKYFENVNKEQVQVSLWGGYVQLKNLRFRKDALRAWDTAVCVKEGSIDEFTVVIPWTRLQSECVVVTVKRVRVVLQQKLFAGYDPVREKEEAYERRQHQLRAFDVLLQQEELASEGGDTPLGSSSTLLMEGGEEAAARVEAQKDATFSARLKANILNNIQLALEDVIVRYEGAYCCGKNAAGGGVSYEDRNFHSCSVALDRFQTHACDENYRPHFTAARERVLYKRVLLEGMRILLDENVDGIAQIMETPLDAMDKSSGHVNSSSSSSLEPSTMWRRHCIVSPLGAVARVQYQPVPYRADLPTARVDLHVDDLRTTLSLEQCRILCTLWREVCDGEEYNTVRRFRPVGEGKRRPTDDARAWWNYAILVTLHRVRRIRERRVFVWESFKRTKAAREEYMMLFQRAQREVVGANWLVALTQEEIRRMQELEMDLPMESIKLARRLAYHRTRLERQHQNTVLETRQRQRQQQRQKHGGGVGVGGGEFGRASDPDSSPMSAVRGEGASRWSWAMFSRFWRAEDSACDMIHEDNPEVRAEVEETLRLVHADRWTAAQRLVIANEFGIPEHEVDDLAEAGNNSSKMPLGTRCQVDLSVHLLGFTFCSSDGGVGAAFVTLEMRGLTSEFTRAANRCFGLVIHVDGCSILSHQPESEMKVGVVTNGERVPPAVEILRVESGCRAAPDGAATEEEEEDDEDDDDGDEACGRRETAMSLSLKRLHSSTCTEYDSTITLAPYKLRMYCGPVVCNLNIPFLRAFLDFMLNPSLFPKCPTLFSLSPEMGRTATAAPTTGVRGKWREGSDPKAQRMALMMAVERELLCDWKLVFCGLRVVVSATTTTTTNNNTTNTTNTMIPGEVRKGDDEQEASRISVQHMVVMNESAKKIERRRRIQRVTGFGDDPCDWVNTVHVSVEGVTVDSLVMAPREGLTHAANDNPRRQWDCIAALPGLKMLLRKSILTRRSPGVALMSVSIEMEHPVRLFCSQQNLFIVCSLVSHITDLFQTGREWMATSETSSSDGTVVFLAHVCVVDDRYLVEHEPLARPAQELLYSACAQAPDVLEISRRVEVALGRLTIYHAVRSALPSHFFELYRPHLHIVHDAEVVSVFIESGGSPHSCRSGVLEAERVLFVKFKFPQIESITLLEAVIEEWCQQHDGGAWEDAVAEVRRAFLVVQSASRTRPCRHVRLRYTNEEMAQRFVDALDAHAVSHRIFGIPPDLASEEETGDEQKEVVEEDSRMLTLEVRSPKFILLLPDETVVRSGNVTTAPPLLVHELVMTSVKLSYEQHTKKKVFDISACSFTVLAHAVSEPVVDVGVADSASYADPAINVCFQMKKRQVPHAAPKQIDITVSSSVRIAFSSKLLDVVEMLWDLAGILTNQAFVCVVSYCHPWSDEPALAIEGDWRCSTAGGLLQLHIISISMKHLVLSLYYPSDGFDSALTVPTGMGGDDNDDGGGVGVGDVECGRKPLAVVEGSQVTVRWSNTRGNNETCCVMQDPHVTVVHLPSAEYCQMVRPACRDAKEAGHAPSPCRSNISLSFVIHRELPMLSTSDYIGNGGAAGYRYTQFLTIAGAHVDVVYRHLQLWSLIEVCTRGVISRATSLVCRRPYIPAMSTPRWPASNDSPAPFSWCLLNKTLDFTQVQFTLPHGDRTHHAVQLWGKAERVRFYDELVIKKGNPGSSIKNHCVQHISTLLLMGLEVYGLPCKGDTLAPPRHSSCSSSSSSSSLSKRVTLLSSTNFRLDLSHELFRAGGWPGQRPRCFCLCLSDPVIFQGSTHHLAVLLEWLDANYFRTPWNAHFLPKAAAVDPFLVAAGNPSESTLWTVLAHYLCLRMMDPAQDYSCVADRASFSMFERAAIDIAVVMECFSVDLHWGTNGAFMIHCSIGELSVWQLGHHVQRFAMLLRHPSEIVHESFRFIWLQHDTTVSPSQTVARADCGGVGGGGEEEEEEEEEEEDDDDDEGHSDRNKPTQVALRVAYEVNMEDGVMVVSSCITVDRIDVTLVPSFLYDLRDSILSLRVQNAFAGILHREPHVVGVLPHPPNPELQRCNEYRCFSLRLLNLTLPRFFHFRQQVVPLFLASVLGTLCEYRASCSGHCVGQEWSLSVDRIGRNGVVVALAGNDISDGNLTLRPIVVPPLVQQQQQQQQQQSEKTCSTASADESLEKLLVATKMASGSLEGYFASVWIVLPLKRDIYALHDVLVKGGYAELLWLTVFFEERWAWRNGILRCSGRDAPFPLRIAIHPLCIAVLEHESVVACNPGLGRGVVCSLGKTTITSDVHNPDMLHFSLSGVNVKSLGEDSHYVVKPLVIQISILSCRGETLELQMQIDAINIHVEQSLYELMLHSVVRHFVVTEAELLEMAAAAEAGIDAREHSLLLLNPDCINLPLGGVGVTTSATAADGADVSVAPSSPLLPRGLNLRVRVECDSFTLRVLRDSVALFASVGTMFALYDHPVTKEALYPDTIFKRRTIQLSLAFVALGVDGAPHLLDLHPHPCPCATSDEVGAGDSIAPPAGRCLSLRVVTHDQGEVVHVNFGKAVIFLEKNTMLSLLSTLYEPYRRIVLPEYRVHEVKYIDSNIELQERLIFSKHRKVHVVQGRYNHITIDARGHDIHFIDAGSPLLSLEEGLTLRIINAHIHLYGKALEYYITVGNGSYVVADATCNTIISGTHRTLENERGVKNESKPTVSCSEKSVDACRMLSIRSDSGGGGGLDRDGCSSSVSIRGMTTAAAPFHSNDVTCRIFASAVLLLTLPEGTSELCVGSARAPRPSRSLVLAATMSTCMEMVQRDGCIEKSGTFDLSGFTMRCEYLDAHGCVVDTSLLVSEWALTLRAQIQGRRDTPTERRIDVMCPRGLEIRLRYGDVSLCWRAVHQVRRALGHIETNVFDNVVDDQNLSSQMAREFQNSSGDPAPVQGKTTFSLHLRYLCLDVVDDSTSVDIPLFRVRVEKLVTSTAVKDSLVLMLHIPCTWNIMYYDFSSSSWSPLLEPVLLDFVMRREPNVSLEDVKQRKGSLRVGFHLRAMHMHFSIMVAENLRRLLLLKQRLEHALVDQEGHVGEMSPTLGKMQFYTYKVAQYLGCDLHIQFACDDHDCFPPPCTLNTREVLQFNFPRIEGHELPVSQHFLLVTFRHKTELVNIATVGKRLVRLGSGMMSTHVLMDVSVVGGQKLVTFRTNVAFQNNLPFAMDVKNVGVIQPGETLHVPVDCLRSRTLFAPFSGRDCITACSLGMSYDMLPYLYEQVFLGVCTLDFRKETETKTRESACISSASPLSLPQPVYFLLRFGAKSCVKNSSLLDCIGNFEAPFFIVNGTCLPMRVGLMYRGNAEKHRSMLNFSDINYYEHITTIDIAPEERSPITQMNPLRDVYVDVFIVQANGEPIGKTCSFSGGKQSPVLVHSANKRGRERTIKLHDPRGTFVVLHLDYTPRTVTIWCPYWIVNQTPYHLQISDVKKGAPLAGLRSEEGIAPSESGGGIGSAKYIANSERMERLEEKSFVHICIGRYSSTGGLKWSKWSDQCFTGVLCERGVISCALCKSVNMMLSYTVKFVGGRVKATRIVTFSPCWVVENRIETPIAIRQCCPSLKRKGDRRKGNIKNLLLHPVTLEPDEKRIVSLSGVGWSSNAIEVCMLDNEAAGIHSCRWSQPLNMDKLGDTAFNLSFETRVMAQDHSGTLPNENIIHIRGELYIVRFVSDVLMFSCFRRGGIVYVLISRPERPPHVIENRTAYTVLARQRDLPHHVVVYPHMTSGFAWEDPTSQPVMELSAEDMGVKVKSVLINFDPRAVLKRSEQLQQELYLPDGVVLFVRVRELGRMSYAISVTTEKTIDAFCSLPYFQLFFQVEVDSVHVLVSDEREDFVLLTMKPVKLTFSQGAESGSDGSRRGGDEQFFEFSLCVIQIDDERVYAKECVVAQLVENKPSTIRFTRKLLRVAPIVYFKDFGIHASSLEVHLEDSFLFQAMRYWERMRLALGAGVGVLGGGGGGSRDVDAVQTHVGVRHPRRERSISARKRQPTGDAWKLCVVFIDHLLIEQITISISLYRSPGEQNDPMWDRIGYLSLFIRSVRDARFVWRRIEQWGVYETLWLLGVSYSSYYKNQLLQQMPNVVHVAGLDMMRGFVTDLLQGYFSSAVVAHIDRTKKRVGRRAEAHFAKDDVLPVDTCAPDVDHNLYGIRSEGSDETLRVLLMESTCRSVAGSSGGGQLHEISQQPDGASASMRSVNYFSSSHPLGTNARVIEAALRLPWSAFCARVTDDELCKYGVLAVQRFLRTLDFANSPGMQWQFDDLTVGNSALATPENTGLCRRCVEIDLMRAQRFDSDSPSVLPHPTSGILTWAEFAHHISWSEFVQMCSPSEIRKYAGVVLRFLVGQPMNVLRIEGDAEWILDRKKEGDVLDTAPACLSMKLPLLLDVDDVLHAAEESTSPSFFYYASPVNCVRARSQGSIASDTTVMSPVPFGSRRSPTRSDVNRLLPEEPLCCDTPIDGCRIAGVDVPELCSNSQQHLSGDMHADAASPLTTLLAPKYSPQDTAGDDYVVEPNVGLLLVDPIADAAIIISATFDVSVSVAALALIFADSSYDSLHLPRKARNGTIPMPPKQQQHLQARTPQSNLPGARTLAPPQKTGALSAWSENIPRRAISTAKTTRNNNTPPLTNPRTKSVFEVVYEESLAQLTLLQQKLQQQALDALQLERNALDYYYANDIGFDGYDGKRVVQESSVWHHYYFSSVISQAKRMRRERRAQEERQLDEERQRVQSLEDDVRDRIINGELAEQKRIVEDSEEEYRSLLQHLSQKEEEGEAHRAWLQEEEEKQQLLQKQRLDAAVRIQQLESERRQQMEDSEATRQLIVSQREKLAITEAELQRKETVVDDLRESIARLTRKRKQRV